MSGSVGRIVPVILAGGKGTRLWPISRSARPKQFLNLAGDNSLFQQTLMRVSNRKKFAEPIVITNNEYRFFWSPNRRSRQVLNWVEFCLSQLHAIPRQPYWRQRNIWLISKATTR